MPIFGYGEDALTLWALTQRLGVLLDALDDSSKPDDALVFFRPSFGRRGASETWEEGQSRASQFGEFDAIIATPQRIALVEAKRGQASELLGDTISLRSEQVRRHAIMRWYVNNWRAMNPAGLARLPRAERRSVSDKLRRDGPSVQRDHARKKPGVSPPRVHAE
jgi:hypothetical protein